MSHADYDSHDSTTTARPFLTNSQMAARAKRAKVYTDKVKSIREQWKEGDKFQLGKNIGVYHRVDLDAEKTSYPYYVSVTWLTFSGTTPPRTRVGLNSFLSATRI